MKEELKAFHIDIDEIKPNNDLFLNINEALNKMAQNYVAERFEVVLNNNLLEAKDKYSNFRTILGCRISYDNLDKNISFIVREDKKPSYEELQQELQKKDNIINAIKEELNKDFNTYVCKNKFYGKIFKAAAETYKEHLLYKIKELENDN